MVLNETISVEHFITNWNIYKYADEVWLNGIKLDLDHLKTVLK